MEQIAVSLNESQRMSMDSMAQMFAQMMQSQQQQIEAQQKQMQELLLHLVSGGKPPATAMAPTPDVSHSGFVPPMPDTSYPRS